MSDDVTQYLNDIARHPILSREAQLRHARRIQAWVSYTPPGSTEPDRNAAPAHVIRLGRRSLDVMVRTNLRLVVHLAKRYQNRGLEISDLIQEGSLGLIRGIELFDPTRGYAFSTYSYWWIRQSITRALYNSARTIRLPINVQDHVYKIAKFTNSYTATHGVGPSLAEISEATELDIARITDVLSVVHITDCGSIDAISKASETDINDVLTVEHPTDSESPELNLLFNERAVLINNALKKLSDKERYVVTAIHFEGSTMQQLSTELGVSRHSVSTVYKNAIRKLQNTLNWNQDMFDMLQS